MSHPSIVIGFLVIMGIHTSGRASGQRRKEVLERLDRVKADPM